MGVSPDIPGTVRPWLILDEFVFAAESAFFRLRREDCSFSALSITTFAMRPNSEQMPSIRCTPPCSASCPNMDRNVTTRSMSFVSDFALGSKGFCKILLNRVMSAETG